MSFNAQVVRAVERILQKKTSGALIGQSGDVKRLIFFEQGALVGCRSNLADERLGETMVREGRITEEQLRRAAEHIRSGRKMGQIMVALGYLKGGEIEGYVRLQILEVARRMLLDPCDRLVFSDQVPIDAVTLSPILMTEVFVIAARTLKDVQRCRDEVLTDEFVLIRVKAPLVAADRLDLSREELSVLDSVDSLSTTGDILRSSSLSPETILRALTGLLHAGLIDRAQVVTPDVLLLEDESPGTKDFEKLALTYRRVQNQNHWAVLSLEPGADYSRIERAYQNFRDEFAPAKFAHVPDAELQKKISFIQARLKDAFTTLSAQSQAIAYGKLVQREEEYASQRENWELPASQYEPLAKDNAKAKKVFRRAVEAFRKKDYWTAIQLSRAAIELNEENDAEHYHLLGAALANNPRWRKDAEKHLKIATQVKNWEPRYLVTLARFYHREGNHQSAQQLLEQVKAIAPDHPIPDLDERRSKQAGVKR